MNPPPCSKLPAQPALGTPANVKTAASKAPPDVEDVFTKSLKSATRQTPPNSNSAPQASLSKPKTPSTNERPEQLGAPPLDIGEGTNPPNDVVVCSDTPLAEVLKSAVKKDLDDFGVRMLLLTRVLRDGRPEMRAMALECFDRCGVLDDVVRSVLDKGREEWGPGKLIVDLP